ncbi:hypothetical protein KI387_019448 [Taxus chinensis]|uniref:AAA+ ATPase domain-containing protein n=1 Tax=Taxus chinensis TaxID=29808 RepID=A0AA38G6E4_TAXCH|nr:hypothetical protein KI387_019448 [Taxus chinensis]
MEMWASLGTAIASIVFIRSMAREFLPPELYQQFRILMLKLWKYFSSYVTIIIEENEVMKGREVYELVQSYLSPLSSSAASRLKLNRPKNAKDFTFTMYESRPILDEFDGLKAWWTFHSIERPALNEKRYFELKFHKKDRSRVLSSYLSHVMAEAKSLELRNRQLKIYTNQGGGDARSYFYGHGLWTPVVFEHPATFETLALHPELKEDIKQDLQMFSQREKYYKEVGRVWKRGYFLYGPPGTGKTSLIAAIANYLQYDIYDLDLNEAKSDSQLRKLLIATNNKSIIVIEDIDCSLDLSDRKKKAKKESKEDQNPAAEKPENETPESKVTLSGVLNFTDGLWSCCGSERIIIFTTNNKDRLDSALLRPGRMDKHIHLSFCGFSAFRVLSKNYLRIEEHPLFQEIEVLMETAQLTPAEVSEELLSSSSDATAALLKLIDALRRAKEKAALMGEKDPHVPAE